MTRARERTSKVNLFLYRAKNTSKPRHCSRAPANFLLTDRTYRKLQRTEDDRFDGVEKHMQEKSRVLLRGMDCFRLLEKSLTRRIVHATK